MSFKSERITAEEASAQYDRDKNVVIAAKVAAVVGLVTPRGGALKAGVKTLSVLNAVSDTAHNIIVKLYSDLPED